MRSYWRYQRNVRWYSYPISSRSRGIDVNTWTVSKLDVEGKMFDSRIQGGLLADGINGLLASLATITPMSTYAQNNVRIAVSPSLFHVCDVLANEASGSHRSHSVRKPQCWVCMLVRNPIRNLPFSFFLSTQHS